MIPRISRDQVENEARAKILWGEDPDATVLYLRTNGISEEDTAAFIDACMGERRSIVRGRGLKKILIGCPLAAVPLVTWYIFERMTVGSTKLLILAIAIGLWGLWWVLDGTLKMIFPESEKGDLSDDAA